MTTLHSKSILMRMAVSVSGNFLRSVLGLMAGLIIARGLRPESYGDLMFLITTMSAIQVAMQLGSANAFYTFLCQQSRTLGFYLFYFFWLVLQLVFLAGVIVFVMPDRFLEALWMGQSREVLLVTVLAVFMQKILWPAVGQIGDASRQTFKVQLLHLVVAVVYLIVVLIMYISRTLSVESILWVLIGQFAVASVISYWVLKEKGPPTDRQAVPIAQLAQSYWQYCKPLIILSVAVFLYEFIDRWLLHKFGGSEQQGYYQVAFQISLASLLVTTSIMQVFWKEVAEAWHRKDLAKVQALYRRVSRGLTILSAVIAGLLLPWSREIVLVLLGKAYLPSWPILALMLLYPIYQSLGQVTGAMLFATGSTRKQMQVSLLVIAFSIPLTYVMLAPGNAPYVSGLGMGALGIAIKMVVVSLIAANIQAWVIARMYGWKFDWLFQPVGIFLMLAGGYLAATLVNLLMGVSEYNLWTLVLSIGLSLILYAFFVAAIVWHASWLIGFEKDDLVRLIARVKGAVFS